MSLFHRVLLALYPRDFRAEYGDEWLELARRRSVRELLADTTMALPPLWKQRLRSSTHPKAPRASAMDTLLQDIRYGIRGLLRQPLFAFVTISTMALGIGANTAMFSAIKGLLFDSPFRDPERLIFVAERVADADQAALSYLDLLEYQRDNKVFSSLAGIRLETWNLTGTREPERLDGLQASASLFPTLGVQPLLGRVFGPDDDRPGGDRVVVLSEAFWRRRFGADPRILDRPIQFDGNTYTIIGVMPERFQVWRHVDVFTPLGHQAAFTNRREWRCIYGVGRLQTGTSLQQAQAGMNVIAARLMASDPETRAGRSSSLKTLRDRSIGNLRSALWVLSAVSGLVLLLGCLNVAGLLEASGVGRLREFAVRTALGATRSRLIRQTFTESLLLALGGSLAGLLVASAGARVIAAMVSRFVTEGVALGLDGSSLVFNCLLTLFAGLVAGVLPAWLLGRTQFTAGLKSGSHGVLTPARARLQGGLVVVQVTLAVVALFGSSLMVHSFARLVAVPLGVDPAGVVVADITLPGQRYSTADRAWQFYRDVLRESAQTPGVVSSAVMTTAPMSFVPWNLRYVVEGEAPAPSGREDLCDYAAVSSDYFRTLGVRVVEGRTFTAQDNARHAPVAIIDRTFAAKHLQGGRAVGRRLSFPSFGGRWMEIVGVVDHVCNWGPDGRSFPEVFVPILQSPSAYVSLAVRARGDSGPVMAGLRAAVRRVDGDLPLAKVRTMEKVVSQTAMPRRLSAKLLTGLAAIALGLAALGIFGMLNRSVVRRTREIGIRMALGATHGRVLSLFVGGGLRLVVAGLAVGLAGAFLLAPLLSSLVFEVEPRDPLSFIVVPAVFVSVALAACLVPALRAIRVDPMNTLRCE